MTLVTWRQALAEPGVGAGVAEVAVECDHLVDVHVASTSERLHADLLPDCFQRASRRLAVQEVHALALVLPDPSAQTLPEVTAEKVEALLSIEELDSSRLVGM